MGRLTEYFAFMTLPPAEMAVKKEEYYYIEVTDWLKHMRRKLRLWRKDTGDQMDLFEEELPPFYD